MKHNIDQPVNSKHQTETKNVTADRIKCWGRRESHFGTMLVCAPLSKQLWLAARYFFESRIHDTRGFKTGPAATSYTSHT